MKEAKEGTHQRCKPSLQVSVLDLTNIETQHHIVLSLKDLVTFKMCEHSVLLIRSTFW